MSFTIFSWTLEHRVNESESHKKGNRNLLQQSHLREQKVVNEEMKEGMGDVIVCSVFNFPDISVTFFSWQEFQPNTKSVKLSIKFLVSV